MAEIRQPRARLRPPSWGSPVQQPPLPPSTSQRRGTQWGRLSRPWGAQLHTPISNLLSVTLTGHRIARALRPSHFQEHTRVSLSVQTSNYLWESL